MWNFILFSVSDIVGTKCYAQLLQEKLSSWFFPNFGILSVKSFPTSVKAEENFYAETEKQL